MTTQLMETKQDESLTAAQTFLEEAKALTVTNDEELKVADQITSVANSQVKKVHAFMDDDISNAHKAWKGLTSKRKSILDPYEQGIKLIRGRMGTYHQELERKKEEERQRLQEIADAEHAKKVKEQSKKQEEERLALAEEAEKNGDSDLADAFLSEETPQPVVQRERVVVPPTAPKTDANFRTVWKYKVIDESKIPRHFFQLNESMLKAFVKSNKGKSEIPGVEQYADTTAISGRGV